MRNEAALAGAAAAIVLALVGANAYMRYERIMLTAKEAYQKGYEAGKAAVSTPKVCTAWWFGEDAKVRHAQAVEAYCKGRK